MALFFQLFLALVALVPLVAGLPSTGSYSSFTVHGQTHGYGQGQEHGEAPRVHSAAEPLFYDANRPHAAEPTYKPAPAPYHPAPAPYNPEPYHAEPAPYHPAPAPYHPKPAYGYEHPKPAYGYEHPKHNCSIEDVVEIAEVCTPTFETTCVNVDLAIKRIVDGEYCYDVSRTVCTETTEKIDNEVCSYGYNKKYEETTAKTVEVSFEKKSDTQMVTVCQPSQGHGYQSYGHQYCKEVEQTTSYNVPVVTQIDVDVKVGYPEPIKTCVNKPISLPRITCEVLTENKCVSQPEVEEGSESVEKCTVGLGEPTCQKVELTLPKQVCKELVYGYTQEAEKGYAPHH
jgi:hypothetical protein